MNTDSEDQDAARRTDSYRSVGVDYRTLDAGKREAMGRALGTSKALLARGGRAIDASRGEPAFVFEAGGQTLAFVLETLGTKSIVAREVHEQLGLNLFDNLAYDTVAAVVNDLCCVGALPLVVNAYFATGSSAWYEERERHSRLLAGWAKACADAGAAWGGGESPSLPGLLAPADIELAGSAVGTVPDGRAPILGAELTAGDEIVLVESSGLHANGASIARAVVDRQELGYAAPLPGGRALGEALMDPTPIYSGLVGDLLAASIEVHYLSHITGHGLLKLMRPTRELTYRITTLPEVPEALGFLTRSFDMSPAAAYSTFNMGAGFAVYCAAGTGDEVVDVAKRSGHAAHLAGVVDDGPRRVILEPLDLTYESGDLELSPGHGRV